MILNTFENVRMICVKFVLDSTHLAIFSLCTIFEHIWRIIVYDADVDSDDDENKNDGKWSRINPKQFQRFERTKKKQRKRQMTQRHSCTTYKRAQRTHCNKCKVWNLLFANEKHEIPAYIAFVDLTRFTRCLPYSFDQIKRWVVAVCNETVI